MTVLFDFSRSLPPTPPMLGAVLSKGLAAISSGPWADLIHATTPRGEGASGAAAVAWLADRLGADLDPDRVLIANGTQSAVLLLMQSLVAPGKVLAAECLSYGMLRSLSDIARTSVEGLPIDGDGLVPDALDRACGYGRVGAIYCNPTFHNPTASVMSTERRLAILAVARRHGLKVIEDDPLGVLYPDLPPPLAALAPEQVWHVAGLTKSIAQGLRVAYVIAPNVAEREAFLGRSERLSHWVAAPVNVALATWLVESGHGAEIRAAIAEENLARETAAKQILAASVVDGARGSPHLWLPLPPEVERRVADRLERDGVRVRGEDLFRVDDTCAAPSGIRLSLSSPRDRARVLEGLDRIRQHLEREVPDLASASPKKEVR